MPSLEPRPGLDINFASAGFKEHGKKAGKPIREVALELGFSLEDHVSEVISPEHITNADLIIHMGPGNERRFDKKLVEYGLDLPFYMSRTYCLGEFCTPPRKNIQDFAFLKHNTPEFDNVVRYTVKACEKLMQEVIVPMATKEQANGAYQTETEKSL